MIVVDSSVWIALLRNEERASVRRLPTIVTTGSVLVGDIVLLEVLQGARDERHAGRIERHLRAFTVVRMLDADIAIRAAANYRELRGRGVTVRKTVDVIIATFCIENGHTLLHDDRDFLPFVQYLGLRES